MCENIYRQFYFFFFYSFIVGADSEVDAGETGGKLHEAKGFCSVLLLLFFTLKNVSYCCIFVGAMIVCELFTGNGKTEKNDAFIAFRWTTWGFWWEGTDTMYIFHIEIGMKHEMSQVAGGAKCIRTLLGTIKISGIVNGGEIDSSAAFFRFVRETTQCFNGTHPDGAQTILKLSPTHHLNFSRQHNEEGLKGSQGML